MKLMSDTKREFARDTLDESVYISYGLLHSLQRLLTGVPALTDTQIKSLVYQAIVWNLSKLTRVFYRGVNSDEQKKELASLLRAYQMPAQDCIAQLFVHRNINQLVETCSENELFGTPVHQKLVSNSVFDDLTLRIEICSKRASNKRAVSQTLNGHPSSLTEIRTDLSQRYFLLRDIQFLLTGIRSYGGDKEDGLFKLLAEQTFKDHNRPFYKYSPVEGTPKKLTAWATTIMTSSGSLGGSRDSSYDLPPTFFPCFEDHASMVAETSV